MILTQEVFRKQWEAGHLRLCFIGMSNIGKSHAAQLLQELGAEIYEVDEEIQKAMDLSDIHQSAGWMGFPYEPEYADKEKFYLALEAKKTQSAPLDISKNLILDTTGSVIELSSEIHQWLQENFCIVNFDVAQSMTSEMAEQYFVHPKPVVWGKSFQPNAGENGTETLKRCYPDLLQTRVKKYRALADITLPGEFTAYRGLTADRLFEILCLSFPKE